MKTTFRKSWVNPLYFILNDIIKDDTIRLVLVYGGKSSAKTISICQLLAKECVLYRNSSLAFRKENAILKTTLKKSFDLAIKTMRLNNGLEPLDFMWRSYTGGEIVLKGLDKEEKAKGVESYKYIYLDELNQFTQSEFQQLNFALRGSKGQKLFCSWNPVDEQSWVKTDLIDRYEYEEMSHTLPCVNSFVKRSKCGKVVLIKTTYEDNYWISGSPDSTYGYRDENLILQYEEEKIYDYQYYLVNVLGEWGSIKPGNPFFYGYKSTMFKDEEFDLAINSDLILQFDFNKDPCTLSVSMINYKHKEFSWFDAMATNEKTMPGLTPLEALCTLFNRKYVETGLVHPAYLTITGDASGKSGSADRKESDNFYSTIQRMLGVSKHQIKLRRQNEAHTVSREKCNGMLNKIPVSFYRNAKLLVRDLDIAYADEKGTLNEAKKNKDLGGLHFADSFRYGVDCMLGFDNWQGTIQYYKENFK